MKLNTIEDILETCRIEQNEPLKREVQKQVLGNQALTIGDNLMSISTLTRISVGLAVGTGLGETAGKVMEFVEDFELTKQFTGAMKASAADFCVSCWIIDVHQFQA